MVAGDEESVKVGQHLQACERFGAVTDSVAQIPDRLYSLLAEISMDSFKGREVGVYVSKNRYFHDFTLTAKSAKGKSRFEV